MIYIVYHHLGPVVDKIYLINYFIRFRIHTAIKFWNKSLISDKIRKIKKNRKLVILNIFWITILVVEKE